MLCVCLYIFYAYVCVCVDKNNNCDISAAAHLRGPGEVAHKPADYLVGPAGSPIFPTQTPAVKHILLAPSFFLLAFLCPVVLLSFCIIGLPRHLRRCHIFHLSSPSSHSFFSLLRSSASRCFPGIVPIRRFTPTLAIFLLSRALTEGMQTDR